MGTDRAIGTNSAIGTEVILQHSGHIEIRLLGELEVRRGQARVDFPPSKKTRALLAYLVASGRSHRRERLCSLLWDVTDDPRGALRWSLSKLRRLVNDPECERLIADRDSVRFDARAAVVDILEFRRSLDGDLHAQPTDVLEGWVARYGGTFLEGLELTEFHDFQAWCIAERENTRRLRVSLLEVLLSRLKEEPQRCLPHALSLAQADPLNATARAELIRLSCELGRHAEAEEHYRAGQRLFKELGGEEPRQLREARAHLQRRPVSVEAELMPQSSERAPLSSARDEAPTSTLQLGDLPPLVGRTDVLCSIREALSQCVARQSQHSLLILGEPGVGKSRVLAEIRADAYQRGGTVIDGRAYEAEIGRPYGPWIDALRRLSRQGLSTTAHEQLARLQPRLSESGTEASREGLLAAVSAFVRQRATPEAPVYLLLDDVQWADEASVAMLHYVLRMNQGVPLFSVLAARDGELGDNVPMSRVVRKLHREHRLSDLRLTRLSPEETEELVRRIVPEATAMDVFTQSAGNPLFALEIARSAVAGRSDAHASLVSVVRERIERLPQGAADVMRWGAVLGSVFSIERLEPLVAMDAEELARALETLERHALLSTDECAYVFCHDVVRDAVYSELSPPRRRLMHRSVARALERLAERDETIAGELAHHAALAGEGALAVRACVAAAKRCLRLFANRQADTLCRRGLFHAAQLDEEQRVIASLDLLQVQCRARRPSDLASTIEQLEELAQRAMDFGRMDHARSAFNAISHLRWEQGSWNDAKRNSLAAELLSRSGEDSERVVAMAEAARCLVVLGRDFVDAEAMLLEAKSLARRVGREPVQLADGIGLLRLQQGQMDDAAEHFERARMVARREGERAAEFEAWAHLLMLDLERECYSEALAHAQQLVPLAQKLRDGSELPFANALDGLCRYALEQPEGAAQLESGLDDLRLADAKYRLAFVLNRAAWLAMARRQSTQVAARATEALHVAGVLEHPSEMAFARVLLCKLALDAGDRAAVELHSSELDALLPKASAQVHRVRDVLGLGASLRRGAVISHAQPS